MGYEEAFMDKEKCKWKKEGICTNPEDSKGNNAICDIEPQDCTEKGFEWET